MRSLPFSGDNGLDQLPFGHGQSTQNADHQEVFDEVYADLLRPPSQIVLLKANNPLADGCFTFCLREDS